MVQCEPQLSVEPLSLIIQNAQSIDTSQPLEIVVPHKLVALHSINALFSSGMKDISQTLFPISNELATEALNSQIPRCIQESLDIFSKLFSIMSGEDIQTFWTNFIPIFLEILSSGIQPSVSQTLISIATKYSAYSSLLELLSAIFDLLFNSLPEIEKNEENFLEKRTNLLLETINEIIRIIFSNKNQYENPAIIALIVQSIPSLLQFAGKILETYPESEILAYLSGLLFTIITKIPNEITPFIEDITKYCITQSETSTAHLALNLYSAIAIILGDQFEPFKEKSWEIIQNILCNPYVSSIQIQMALTAYSIISSRCDMGETIETISEKCLDLLDSSRFLGDIEPQILDVLDAIMYTYSEVLDQDFYDEIEKYLILNINSLIEANGTFDDLLGTSIFETLVRLMQKQEKPEYVELAMRGLSQLEAAESISKNLLIEASDLFYLTVKIMQDDAAKAANVLQNPGVIKMYEAAHIDPIALQRLTEISQRLSQ